MFKDTGECPRRCRLWKDCTGKDYFELSEISYCFNQVEYLILNFLHCEGNEILLERDTWPDNKMSENYSTSPSSHAPFEAVMMCVGELRTRLALTGLSGRVLVLEICQGIQLSDDAKWARGYVAGNKRKTLSFSDWKKQKKQRQVLERGMIMRCSRCKGEIKKEVSFKYHGGVFCKDCAKWIKKNPTMPK
jgi:hypothetical protein